MARKTRLFDVAQARGISQRELAALTGIPESTLSRVRSGERPVSLQFIDRVMDALPADWGTEAELFPREEARAS